MASNADRPAAASAKVQMLFNGYVDTGVSPFSVASSIAFVRDGDVRVIIDPGIVPGPRSILNPLEQLGESAAASECEPAVRSTAELWASSLPRPPEPSAALDGEQQG